MARRKNSSDDDISLFPFLSVIACLIGVLTLIIAALSFNQMDNDTVARAQEYEQIKSTLDNELLEIKNIQLELTEKQKELGQNQSEDQKKLESLRKRLANLLKKEEAARKEFNEIVRLSIPKVNVKQQQESIDQMQDELKGLKEKIAQLDKQIADRNIELKEAEVSILPSGSGVGFTPKFVECAAGRVVLHTTAKPLPIRTNELANNETYQKLLDEVKAQDKTTLVFLIRDDGLGTYYTARNLANTKAVKNGKLPVLGKGRIDLSYFNKKK